MEHFDERRDDRPQSFHVLRQELAFGGIDRGSEVDKPRQVISPYSFWALSARGPSDMFIALVFIRSFVIVHKHFVREQAEKLYPGRIVGLEILPDASNRALNFVDVLEIKKDPLR